jgi:2-oxoglutarate dehydrogenase E2 component (dihydrolipoamide succinyltransferase)
MPVSPSFASAETHSTSMPFPIAVLTSEPSHSEIAVSSPAISIFTILATALPSGNLIVPVIKNADQLNLVGLTKQVNALANAARNNKLRPDDTTGGTFTLTNVGTFGSIMGTPIINQPQVAIMAVGAIKKRPMVIETPQGDTIGIRHMMYISLSYDHRIIDGALGSSFLNAVSKELENFDSNRGI